MLFMLSILICMIATPLLRIYFTPCKSLEDTAMHEHALGVTWRRDGAMMWVSEGRGRLIHIGNLVLTDDQHTIGWRREEEDKMEEEEEEE